MARATIVRNARPGLRDHTLVIHSLMKRQKKANRPRVRGHLRKRIKTLLNESPR